MEHGGQTVEREEPFNKNTAEFTKLASKYAPHLAIYLYRKVKIFVRAFLRDIRIIPHKEDSADWKKADTTEN